MPSNKTNNFAKLGWRNSSGKFVRRRNSSGNSAGNSSREIRARNSCLLALALFWRPTNSSSRQALASHLSMHSCIYPWRSSLTSLVRIKLSPTPRLLLPQKSHLCRLSKVEYVLQLFQMEYEYYIKYRQPNLGMKLL